MRSHRSVGSQRPKEPRSRSRIAVASARLFAPLLAGLLGKQQQHRRMQFEALGPSRGRVVFLGDSISEFGLWEEWFPDVPVLNRGIGGETSAQVLARLDTAINEPAAVLLLIGTNDLSMGIPEADILTNIRSIMQGIERRAPGSPVWVQSVMPRTLQLHPEIHSLNAGIRRLVADSHGQVTYLDLWPFLATYEGVLREEYSLDRLHLNGEGTVPGRPSCGQPCRRSAATAPRRPTAGGTRMAVTMNTHDARRCAGERGLARLANTNCSFDQGLHLR